MKNYSYDNSLTNKDDSEHASINDQNSSNKKRSIFQFLDNINDE